MILSVVKGLLIYVNVSQEQWTGFFLICPFWSSMGVSCWGLAVGERGAGEKKADN
ncbi:hypothetical protein MYAER_1311 [Microcystis aeruginosa NIES-2549]|uniref:Uncharacterized protein n=1 Tax=Microcystis aeruginosa NIES-2549 TaxID=1641812 RepID=A0A0F6U3E2_MICAE|nr:hypothetical protein MYAER_1311 [Microcystis aeruginosa NIES-2549]AOC52059.1 hypothetical protein amyaer_1324 [Microcystis aeruginosa NIES-2481]